MDDYYSSPRYRNAIALPGNMSISPGSYSYPSIRRARSKSFPKTPPVDPYSSRYGNLLKLLHSNSPPSVLDNIGPMTPMNINMEEGTLLVDITSVESSSGGSSGNGYSRRPSYRVPEESNGNLYASKTRLTRGKEELQHASPSRLSVRNRFSEAVKAAAAGFGFEAQKAMAASPSRPAQVHKQTTVKFLTQDWSPVDDWIVVPTPSQSRKDIDSYIHRFVYGERDVRRLPVFTEITHQ